jgi:hypothetical protein
LFETVFLQADLRFPIAGQCGGLFIDLLYPTARVNVENLTKIIRQLNIEGSIVIGDNNSADLPSRLAGP